VTDSSLQFLHVNFPSTSSNPEVVVFSRCAESETSTDASFAFFAIRIPTFWCVVMVHSEKLTLLGMMSLDLQLNAVPTKKTITKKMADAFIKKPTDKECFMGNMSWDVCFGLFCQVLSYL